MALPASTKGLPMKLLTIIVALVLLQTVLHEVRFVCGEAALPREKAEPPAKAKSLITLPKDKTPVEKWMKDNDWTSARDDPSKFKVGDGRLHLVSKGDSVMIGTKAGFPVDPAEWTRIRIRLRVDRNPTGADLSRTSGDDAAFRLYVGFDRGGGLLSPPNTLVYSWTENVAEGTVIQSAHYKQLRYLSIGSGVTTEPKDKGAAKTQGGEAGKTAEGEPGWVTVERNVIDDYRKAFPEDKKAVPSITGIVLKCDSNNTGTSAESWLSSLELLPAKK